MAAAKQRSAQEDVKQSFDIAADRLGLAPGVRLMFCEPWRELRRLAPRAHGRWPYRGFHRLPRPA